MPLKRHTEEQVIGILKGRMQVLPLMSSAESTGADIENSNLRYELDKVMEAFDGRERKAGLRI